MDADPYEYTTPRGTKAYPLHFNDLVIIFEIEAKSPDGKDGVGRIWYFKGEEHNNGFHLNGENDIRSGERFTLAFLTEAWNYLMRREDGYLVSVWKRATKDKIPNAFNEEMKKWWSRT